MNIPTCSVRLAPDGRHALLNAAAIHTQTLTAVAQTLAADAYEETATALYEVAKLTGFELREDPAQYGQQTVRDAQGLHDPHGQRADEAIENVIDHIGRDVPVEVLEVADVDRLIGQLIAVRSRMAFDAVGAPFFEPAEPRPAPEQLAIALEDAPWRPCPNPDLCGCDRRADAAGLLLQPPPVPEPPATVEDLERAIRENRGVPAIVAPTLPVAHSCPDLQKCTCGPAVVGQTPGGVHVLRRSPDGTGE